MTSNFAFNDPSFSDIQLVLHLPEAHADDPNTSKKTSPKASSSSRKRKRDHESKSDEHQGPPAKRRQKSKWSAKDLKAMKQPLKDFIIKYAANFSEPDEHKKMWIDEVQSLEIHASRGILATHSLFFRTMWKSRVGNTEEKCIRLQMESTQEMHYTVLMLQYIYNSQLPDGISVEALLYLFVLADRYEVVSLMNACLVHLEETAMQTATHADLVLQLLDSQVIMTPVCKQVCVRAVALLRREFADLNLLGHSDAFLSLSLTALRHMYGGDRSQMAHLSENTLYRAMRNWMVENDKFPRDILTRILRGHELSAHFFQDVVAVDPAMHKIECGQQWMQWVTEFFMSSMERKRFIVPGWYNHQRLPVSQKHNTDDFASPTGKIIWSCGYAFLLVYTQDDQNAALAWHITLLPTITGMHHQFFCSCTVAIQGCKTGNFQFRPDFLTYAMKSETPDISRQTSIVIQEVS